MKATLCLVFALALAAPAFGVTLNRCSLAQQMAALRVPRSELPQWTCIAEHESSFRTGVVGPTLDNGSNDYVIFQINDQYWCQPPNGRFSHNECDISCDALLTDDITNSVRCAQKAKSLYGWSTWSAWNFCFDDLPSINDCF